MHEPLGKEACEDRPTREGTTAPGVASASQSKDIPGKRILRHCSGQRETPRPTTRPLPIASEIDSAPAVRQQLLDVYLSRHVSKDGLGVWQHRVWLYQIPEMPRLAPALEYALMAVCVANLGQFNNDEVLIHESLKLYQRGLHQLQLALWDPDLIRHDHTLATCIALGMYEMSQCPDRSKHGYISHIKGCAKLMQERGPEMHKDGLGHSLFVHFRVSIILHALDQGRDCFLLDRQWQTVPWQSEPRTLYDKMYDFLMRAPELNRKGSTLRYLTRPQQLHVATWMIGKCWDMDAELEDVYKCLQRENPGDLYWYQLAKDKLLHGESEDGMLFPVAFHFPNLSVANTLFIYWGVQAILWNGMSRLYKVIAELRLYFQNVDKVLDGEHTIPQEVYNAKKLIEGLEFPPLEHRADFATPCRSIFQSMEYALSDEMLDQGPKCIVAPVRIAYETLLPYYPSYADELGWAGHALELLQKRSMKLLKYYEPRRDY
jgi:hypothetical protein